MADAQIPIQKDSRLARSPKIQPQGWCAPGQNHLFHCHRECLMVTRGTHRNPTEKACPVSSLAVRQVLIKGYSQLSRQQPSYVKISSIPAALHRCRDDAADNEEPKLQRGLATTQGHTGIEVVANPGVKFRGLQTLDPSALLSFSSLFKRLH